MRLPPSFTNTNGILHVIPTTWVLTFICTNSPCCSSQLCQIYYVVQLHITSDVFLCPQTWSRSLSHKNKRSPHLLPSWRKNSAELKTKKLFSPSCWVHVNTVLTLCFSESLSPSTQSCCRCLWGHGLFMGCGGMWHSLIVWLVFQRAWLDWLHRVNGESRHASCLQFIIVNDGCWTNLMTTNNS